MPFDMVENGEMWHTNVIEAVENSPNFTWTPDFESYEIRVKVGDTWPKTVEVVNAVASAVNDSRWSLRHEYKTDYAFVHVLLFENLKDAVMCKMLLSDMTA